MHKTCAHLSYQFTITPFHGYHHILAEKTPLPRLTLGVVTQNIHPGRITLYKGGGYIREQCAMLKTFASLFLECTITININTIPFCHKNTTPRLDMVVLSHNTRLDRINQHNTSLYIGEQLPPLKHTATLVMGAQ